jgi:5-methylthioadenosine/S-adenosylhomocysteine deaminase
MRMFDILIHNSTVITLNEKREIISGCSIGIKQGRIEAVGPKIAGEAREIIDGSDSYVLPGLINCHTHVYQALIEGVGYDMHFNPWNMRYLIPIISHMKPRHARACSELAALEMIRSGTTSFSDHWYLHTDFNNIEEVAEGFTRSGLRNQLVFGFLNESFAGRTHTEGSSNDVLKEEDELLDRAAAFAADRHKKGLTTVGFGPGSTEDVKTGLFVKIIELGKKLDVHLVTHIAGWVEIVSRSLEKFKMRDFEYAHSLGFAGEKSIAIHGVWLSDYEIELAAATGTAVAHNPVANMHLGYGIAPIPQMLKAGVKVGLGTDGAASYTYDMLEVAKTAAMLQKARKMDAEALTAENSLELATIGGARVLGLDKIVGSIETGKRADLIIIAANKPHLMKGGRAVPSLVYSARSSDVTTSIVDGKLLMKDGVVLSMDESEVINRAQSVREELFSLGGEVTKELLEAPWPKRGASWRAVNG